MSRGETSDAGSDDGLPADAAADAAPLRDVLRRQADRDAAAGPELPPLHLSATWRGARSSSRSRCSRLGLERGDRVATLCWNHYQHMEAYFGIPCGGFVLHTLNLRLHPNDLAYIATHAGDRAVIVDRSLLPLLEQFRDTDDDRARLRRRGLVRGAARGRERGRLARPRAGRERGGGDVLHERHDRAAEGRRLLAPLDGPAHARRRARTRRSASRISEQDTILPVVPMFHANAWGYPYHVRDASARRSSFPGPYLDPESLLEDFVRGGRHLDGRRADDLDGHPAGARRGARPLGPLADEGHARRRLGGAAGADRGASSSGTA